MCCVALLCMLRAMYNVHALRAVRGRRGRRALLLLAVTYAGE
jgi:hypothetical protein